MLSETQSERLLTELEASMGKRLEGLRTQLLREPKTKAVLWELIALYASQKTFGIVEHEPDEGCPDIIVRNPSLAIEACLVESPSQKLSSDLSMFEIFLNKALLASGFAPPARDTQVKAIDTHNPISVPPEHKWSGIVRSPEFQSYSKSLLEIGKGSLTLPENNLVISMSSTNRKYSSGSRPGLYRSKEISEHPLYKVIERKGIQIRKWQRNGLNLPVILAVCFEDSGPEFDDGLFGGKDNVSHVVLSALHSSQKLDVLTILNQLRQSPSLEGGVVGPPKLELQVKGGRDIAAVITVRVVTSVASRTHQRKMHSKLYINSHAERPLTKEQIAELHQLDFSVVEIGPGWEAWEETQRGSLLERNLKLGGGWMFRDKGDGFELELSAVSLVQILSGERTCESLFGPIDQPPNPASLCRMALERGHPLVGVALLEPNDQRGGVKVCLKFGGSAAPLLSRAKEEK